MDLRVDCSVRRLKITAIAEYPPLSSTNFATVAVPDL